MLDPTAEEIQHAKKQRERIYNDDVYFTLKSVSEGISEWAYNSGKFVYETDNDEFGVKMKPNTTNTIITTIIKTMI